MKKVAESIWQFLLDPLGEGFLIIGLMLLVMLIAL